MRQHFAIHPINIKDTDIENVHYDPVYIGDNDTQDHLHPKFSMNFITSLLGLIDADYASACLKMVHYL